MYAEQKGDYAFLYQGLKGPLVWVRWCYWSTMSFFAVCALYMQCCKVCSLSWSRFWNIRPEDAQKDVSYRFDRLCELVLCNLGIFLCLNSSCTYFQLYQRNWRMNHRTTYNTSEQIERLESRGSDKKWGRPWGKPWPTPIFWKMFLNTADCKPKKWPKPHSKVTSLAY